ncbi:hypothetical protein M2282_000655 [Variovorax boronicumulans]|uniref:hypothetical protein n=1 Tax=Variovorax boronicumulans TaxID=436515 RepID=UPI00247372E9|nr:hypothetical protein [Variovorax boronicumulans]MDH6165527.1 hypothetical protein [Variovorax boronicumulans]
MKIKFTREKEIWPETEHYQKLRKKGFFPGFRLNCEILRDELNESIASSSEIQYLSSQLRDDVLTEGDASRLMLAAENIMTGQLKTWKSTGNAWTVELGLDGVEFEYAIMDGPRGGRVSLLTYLRALEAWKTFLSDEGCFERIVVLPV